MNNEQREDQGLVPPMSVREIIEDAKRKVREAKVTLPNREAEDE